MANNVQTWVLAARPRTLPAAAVPVVVGSAAAFADGKFSALPALAALIGAFLIQIGANLANDVFDFKKGADTEERLGPTRVTQAGLLTPIQVMFGMAVVFALAILIGCYLVLIGGWPIVVIGISSIICAIAYTGGPFPLGYHGLGDLFVFIFFGLVAVGGTYYVQAHDVTAEALTCALPIGFLATAILVVNNLRDIDTDRRAGKRTLAVRLGKSATKIQYAVLVIGSYLVPILMIVMHRTGYMVLLPLLSVPLALGLWEKVQTLEGKALNMVLAKTAQLELIYGILFAIGLVLPFGRP